MKKRLAILFSALAIVAFLLFFGVNYAIENVFPYSPIRPHRVTPAEIAKAFPGVVNPGSVGLKFVDLDVEVEKGLVLKGWFVFSEVKPARGTILLLHGIASSRFFMIPMARTLARNGFNSILYDSRANGESGGENCTFGFYEKDDLSALLAEALKRFPDAAPFAVYGNSLGAAVAVQAMAVDKRLRCGVVECCFATLREVVHDYFRRMFLLPIYSIPDKALLYSERIADFRVDEVKPEESAKRITRPIMVVHGLEDAHIKAAYGRRVFDNISSQVKRWVPVEKGTHYNLAEVGGDSYLNGIVGFFVQNISKENGIVSGGLDEMIPPKHRFILKSDWRPSHEEIQNALSAVTAYLADLRGLKSDRDREEAGTIRKHFRQYAVKIEGNIYRGRKIIHFHFFPASFITLKRLYDEKFGEYFEDIYDDPCDGGFWIWQIEYDTTTGLCSHFESNGYA